VHIAAGVVTLLTFKKNNNTKFVKCRVAVASEVLKHCQGIDLGYSFIALLHHWLIHAALSFAKFSAVGMAVSLYAGWLIGAYIRYSNLITKQKQKDPLMIKVS